MDHMWNGASKEVAVDNELVLLPQRQDQQPGEHSEPTEANIYSSRVPASRASHLVRIDTTRAGSVGPGRRSVMRSRLQGNNVTKWPPITRQYARSVGEFVVSLPFGRFRNDLRNPLI
jgi:hypothetical protein